MKSHQHLRNTTLQSKQDQVSSAEKPKVGAATWRSEQLSIYKKEDEEAKNSPNKSSSKKNFFVGLGTTQKCEGFQSKLFYGKGFDILQQQFAAEFPAMPVSTEGDNISEAPPALKSNTLSVGMSPSTELVAGKDGKRTNRQKQPSQMNKSPLLIKPSL